MAITILNTEVPEIEVEINDQGHFCLHNVRTEQKSGWTDYRGIGLLPVPEELRQKYGKSAQFMWLTQYHEGVLPSETLMIVHNYDPDVAAQLEDVEPSPEETAEEAANKKALEAIWVGRVTKPYYSPGAMNPTLQVGQFMLFNRDEYDVMYDSSGVKWNAYSTDVVPTSIDYNDLGWSWLEDLSPVDIYNL